MLFSNKDERVGKIDKFALILHERAICCLAFGRAEYGNEILDTVPSYLGCPIVILSHASSLSQLIVYLRGQSMALYIPGGLAQFSQMSVPVDHDAQANTSGSFQERCLDDDEQYKPI
ncbi:MAG: hypothetical protein O7B35_15460 [Deltaproteobacteria bacterium]|nr:hypothetical protein [Deltaproteobacteria bacterium]